MTEPILPDVKENDTKTSEKQKEDIATVPEQEIIETTIPTTTTVENQNALNNEAELQRRKEASEQRAIEESLRKQRETEARLLAEAKRREEARMTEEANKRNQTTYVQEQKVTTPSVTNSIATLGKKKLTDKTSLRQTADSKSSVLKRFAPGDVVTVLEKTNVYWWKVEFKGQIGWVKARLLE